MQEVRKIQKKKQEEEEARMEKNFQEQEKAAKQVSIAVFAFFLQTNHPKRDRLGGRVPLFFFLYYSHSFFSFIIIIIPSRQAEEEKRQAVLKARELARQSSQTLVQLEQNLGKKPDRYSKPLPPPPPENDVSPSRPPVYVAFF